LLRTHYSGELCLGSACALVRQLPERARLAIANFVCVYFFKSAAISANWASAASNFSIGERTRLACLVTAPRRHELCYFLKSSAIVANCSNAASRSATMSAAIISGAGRFALSSRAWKARPLLHPRYGVFEPEDQIFFTGGASSSLKA
jgi:hypothetical protein